MVHDEPGMVRGQEDNHDVEGYQPFTATNGEDALAVAAREAPDLVILDLMMPKMSGWEGGRAPRAKGIDVPIILLTPRGEEADRGGGLELGADHYIAKPFSPPEPLASVDPAGPRPGLQVRGLVR